jgi:hypothetical protein
MKPIVRRALLVIAGFCLGVVTAIGAFFYLIRHPERFEAWVRSSIAADGSLADPAVRLARAEDALATAPGEYQRWVALGDTALLNAEAGSSEKARRYAEELLKTGAKYEADWNFGNAVHKGNLALGLVSLRSGDLEGAKRYLLEAGRTKGSPQLDSFGPNMTLAKALAEKGERDAVIQYLSLCGNFWQMDRGKLREWRALVKDGIVPDFGANLLY